MEILPQEAQAERLTWIVRHLETPGKRWGHGESAALPT